MRVSHVITRLIVGGAQENTVATVLGLHNRPGVDVELISGPTTGPEGSIEAQLQGQPSLLKIIPELVRPVRPWLDLIAGHKLKRAFLAAPPDIVHTHSGKAGILGRWAARQAGVPVIIHTVHGPSFGRFQGAAANFLFRAAERRAAAWTTHFISVAQAMTDQYLAAGIGSPSQYTRILSGFSLDRFLSAKKSLGLRAAHRLQEEHVVFGKIARLAELKGHEDLIAVAPEIIAAVPLARFLLVGDGPWKDRFQTQVRQLGLEKHFVFAGLVKPEEVPSLLGIMDVLVHLSTREGLPRALPQAMAARRPVVAFDCDGAREVCLDSETGFLVPMGDRATLIERSIRLARDPFLRRRLAERGQRLVQELFPVEKMVDQIHALYLALLQQHLAAR